MSVDMLKTPRTRQSTPFLMVPKPAKTIAISAGTITAHSGNVPASSRASAPKASTRAVPRRAYGSFSSFLIPVSVFVDLTDAFQPASLSRVMMPRTCSASVTNCTVCALRSTAASSPITSSTAFTSASLAIFSTASTVSEAPPAVFTSTAGIPIALKTAKIPAVSALASVSTSVTVRLTTSKCLSAIRGLSLSAVSISPTSTGQSIAST